MTTQNLVVQLRFDRFELDGADARLTCAGLPVPLAPTPFAVLCTLARTPHALVTKQTLLDAVWGHRFVSESALKQAISEVRAALGDDPKQPRYIATVARRGYRFIGTAVDAPAQRANALERGGADRVIADLVLAFEATLDHDRLVPDDMDVYRKVLRCLINFAERHEEPQPVRAHAFAQALN